ncbi:MAG TPA: hypothetical protein VIW94_10860 [Acidimicrobiia bacterium]
MMLRLEIPNSDPSLRGGIIKKWHKSEGETVRFGEEVCTLTYSNFAVLRRTGRATLLVGRRRHKIKGGVEAREGKVKVDVVLTTSEPGILQKIARSEGEEFLVGDVIGVVSTTEAAETINGDWMEFPAVRLTANMSSGSEQY